MTASSASTLAIVAGDEARMAGVLEESRVDNIRSLVPLAGHDFLQPGAGRRGYHDGRTAKLLRPRLGLAEKGKPSTRSGAA